MNVVAMSFPNISTDLDFKPDNNYVSPFGQTRRGTVPYQLYSYGNLKSEMQWQSNALTQRRNITFLFPKTILFNWYLIKSRFPKKYYF